MGARSANCSRGGPRASSEVGFQEWMKEMKHNRVLTQTDLTRKPVQKDRIVHGGEHYSCVELMDLLEHKQVRCRNVTYYKILRQLVVPTCVSVVKAKHVARDMKTVSFTTSEKRRGW